MLDLLKGAGSAAQQTLHSSQIRIDGGTQMRAELNATTIEEYAVAMQAGAQFPAIVVYYDGESYWLGDGFHRLAARKKLFEGAVECEVRSGTRRDAVLCAAGANAAHGLRRTNADKRRAVEALLRDEEWTQWSDREIARRCGVHHELVGIVRAELSGGNRQIAETRTVQRNGATYRQSTKNISAANQERRLEATVPATQPITETLDAAVRRATCVHAGDEERWRALAATGADYWQILDLLKSKITSTGGSSGPGWYTIERKRGPIITISKGIGGPVVARLMSGQLVEAVRKAWAIPEKAAGPSPAAIEEAPAPIEDDEAGLMCVRSGCYNPATAWSPDGLPLCQECAQPTNQPTAQPVTAPDDEPDDEPEPWGDDQRLPLAMAMRDAIGDVLRHMSSYGTLTGCYTDIPPAERALKKMSDELQGLIDALC